MTVEAGKRRNELSYIFNDPEIYLEASSSNIVSRRQRDRYAREGKVARRAKAIDILKDLVPLLTRQFPRHIQKLMARLMTVWMVGTDNEFTEWLDMIVPLLERALSDARQKEDSAPVLGYLTLLGLTRVYESARSATESKRCRAAAAEGKRYLEEAKAMNEVSKLFCTYLNDRVTMYLACLSYNPNEKRVVESPVVRRSVKADLARLNILPVLWRVRRTELNDASPLYNLIVFSMVLENFRAAAAALIRLEALVKLNAKSEPRLSEHLVRLDKEPIFQKEGAKVRDMMQRLLRRQAAHKKAAA